MFDIVLFVVTTLITSPGLSLDKETTLSITLLVSTVSVLLTSLTKVLTGALIVIVGVPNVITSLPSP